MPPAANSENRYGKAVSKSCPGGVCSHPPFVPTVGALQAKQVSWKPLSNPLRPKGEGAPVATHLAPKKASMGYPSKPTKSGKSPVPGSHSKDRKTARKTRASVASPKKNPVLGNPATGYQLEYRPTSSPMQGMGMADSSKSLKVHQSQLSPRDELARGMQMRYAVFG